MAAVIVIEDMKNFDHLSNVTQGTEGDYECSNEGVDSTSNSASTTPSPSPTLETDTTNELLPQIGQSTVKKNLNFDDNLEVSDKSVVLNEIENDAKDTSDGITNINDQILNNVGKKLENFQEERVKPSTRSTKKRKLDSDDLYNMTKQDIISPQPLNFKRNNFLLESESDNLIDITDLLPFPQKEAANRLGISESMLCKRFKESTRRKWPYRYLRKIEKMIVNLKKLKKSGSISHQDQLRLDDLLSQRKECLEPVKIRITNHDKLPVNTFSGTKFSSDDDFGSESDEDEFAAETLGLLRSLSPKE